MSNVVFSRYLLIIMSDSISIDEGGYLPVAMTLSLPLTEITKRKLHLRYYIVFQNTNARYHERPRSESEKVTNMFISSYF